MQSAEKWMVLVLRLAGAFMLLALLAIVMPTDWMGVGHRRLGLGEFPASALVDYLTRSVAALYAIHGGLYLALATNVRRHAGVIRYVAWANMIFGAAVIGIDLHAGLPWYWTLVEGPPVIGFGALLLLLLRGIPEN